MWVHGAYIIQVVAVCQNQKGYAPALKLITIIQYNSYCLGTVRIPQYCLCSVIVYSCGTSIAMHYIYSTYPGWEQVYSYPVHFPSTLCTMKYSLYSCHPGDFQITPGRNITQVPSNSIFKKKNNLARSIAIQDHFSS